MMSQCGIGNVKDAYQIIVKRLKIANASMIRKTIDFQRDSMSTVQLCVESVLAKSRSKRLKFMKSHRELRVSYRKELHD